MTTFCRLVAAMVALFMLAAPAAAQSSASAVGDWHGKLTIPTGTLRVIVHIKGNGEKLTGTLDSPDQGSEGIPIDQVVVKDGTLSFTVPIIQGRFDGKWDQGRWTGEWFQGAALPLTLQPLDKPLAAAPALKPGRAGMEEALSSFIANRPGVVAAAALIGPGGTELVQTKGLAEGQRFEIGSITKTFTGLLLADMVLAKKVALDDPVARYLPAGALPPELAAITLRQLAQHRSGLPRLPSNMAVTLVDPYATYGEKQLLDYLRSATLEAKPGEQTSYSNTGMAVLGYALGRADGRGYLAALKSRVIDRLGLKDTDCNTDKRSLSGFDLMGKATAPWMFQAVAPAGCLRSTISDMAKFAAAISGRPGPLRNQVELIKRELSPAGKNSEVGLGIFRIPTEKASFWFHDGWTGGFRSAWVSSDNGDRALVLLTNATATDPGPLALRLIAAQPAGHSATK